MNIYLYNPAAGIVDFSNVIIVTGEAIRVIGTVEIDDPIKVDNLLVTQAALNYLGAEAVVLAFSRHLSRQWNLEEDPGLEDYNSMALKGKRGILYDFPDSKTMIVTFVGHESTLILREEY